MMAFNRLVLVLDALQGAAREGPSVSQPVSLTLARSASSLHAEHYAVTGLSPLIAGNL